MDMSFQRKYPTGRITSGSHLSRPDRQFRSPNLSNKMAFLRVLLVAFACGGIFSCSSRRPGKLLFSCEEKDGWVVLREGWSGHAVSQPSSAIDSSERVGRELNGDLTWICGEIYGI